MGNNASLSPSAITNAWSVIEQIKKDLAEARRRGCDALVAILEPRLAMAESELAMAEKRRDLLAVAETAERDAKTALDRAVDAQYDLEISATPTAKERAEILRRRDDVDVARAIFLVRGRQREAALSAAQNPTAKIVALGRNDAKERAQRTVRGIVTFALTPFGGTPAISPARGHEEQAWEEFYAHEELATYHERAKARDESRRRDRFVPTGPAPRPTSWVIAELRARGVVLAEDAAR